MNEAKGGQESQKDGTPEADLEQEVGGVERRRPRADDAHTRRHRRRTCNTQQASQTHRKGILTLDAEL